MGMRFPACTALLLAALAILVASPPASAQSTIRQPGARPHYSFEAEPHLLVGAPFEGTGFGLGFRGTVELVENGFVKTINNSVGIGFGADWIATGRHCRGRRGCVTRNELILPVVMQWNFWLHRQWSVFGEPGVAVRLRRYRNDRFDPFILYGGGRFHFTDQITLTMRVGYPTFSVGVSFLL